MLFPKFSTTNKRHQVLRHIGIWLLYTAYIYFINYIGNPAIQLTRIIAHLLPMCLVFYVSLYCFTLFKKLGVIAGSLILLLSPLLLLGIGYIYVFNVLTAIGIKLYDSDNILLFLQAAFTGYLQYFIYALLYFLFRTSLRRERSIRFLQEEKFRLENDKKQQQLENVLLKQQDLKAQQENLKLEYALLRAQINPHFLHNTLNVLFSQALMYSQELADNIMKLSKLMRYAMESCDTYSGQVDVRIELHHLKTLIEIHQIRFSDTLHVNLTVIGETSGHMVPPLGLITVVENAFKYGDLKDKERPLMIRVELFKDRLEFYCRNKKKLIQPIDISSNSIGLDNLSKRLNISFKDRYEIHADNEPDGYTFRMTIQKDI